MATGSGRNNRKSAGNKKKAAQNSLVRQEVSIFLALAVAILLFLSTCGLLGAFGKGVGGVLIGLFGMVAYLVPFAFLFGAAFCIMNRWKKVTKVKITSLTLLLWCLSCFCQLIFAKDVPVAKVLDYYTDSTKNGGLLGGMVTHFTCKFLGMAGTIVILITVSIICLVLLTDRSLFASVKNGSKNLYQDAKRKKEYLSKQSEVRKIERAEYYEEQQERRMLREAERNKRMAEKEARMQLKLNEREERARQAMERRRELNEQRAIEEAARREREEAIRIAEEEELKKAEVDAAGENVSGEVTDAKGSDEKVPTRLTEENIPQREISVFDFNGGSRNIEYRHDRKVSGVAADITIPKSTDSYGDIHEITDDYSGNIIEFNDLKLHTSHRINVSEADDPILREAYERDVYVGNAEEHFEKDYSDAVKLHECDDNESLQDVRRFPKVIIESDNSIRVSSADDEETSIDTGELPAVDMSDIKIGEIESREKMPVEVETSIPAKRATVTQSSKSSSLLRRGKYKLPPISLLNEIKQNKYDASDELRATSAKLVETLKTFGVDVSVIGASRGPAVTRYEIQPQVGVKVSKIVSLTDDIKLSLAAADIRMEAPIPGKSAIGIEVPNEVNSPVGFRELAESKEFKEHKSKIAFAVGKDLAGQTVVTDIAKMPHLLIAGATGSGKSVCINTLITSILYKATPEEVRMIMIDPKVVELSVYNGIPHLLIPVVTDAKKANAALQWAVNEMTVRYQKFAELEVRDMASYNRKIASDPEYAGLEEYQNMPQIVVIVDELADLMMVAAKEVEESICRLAQLARAAGIHLILATQRPSVDVITGLIKANMPSRIAFSVSSGVDSRTILDMVGAEKLLGKGDMLFYPQGYTKPARVQGAFVSDEEVQSIVAFIKSQCGGDNYDPKAKEIVENGTTSASSGGVVATEENGLDELFYLAGHSVIEKQKASIGMLQRLHKIGFNRAARIMDQLAEAGVVGPEEGTKPRRILMTIEEFEQYVKETKQP